MTERPRSITGLPQPSPSQCQGQQPPLRSARHTAEPQISAVTKRPSMSSGNPSLQRCSNSSTADVLGSFPSMKHRDSNHIQTELPGNSLKPAAALLGSALLPENASAAAAAVLHSCGNSNQVWPRCIVVLCHTVMQSCCVSHAVQSQLQCHVALACWDTLQSC